MLEVRHTIAKGIRSLWWIPWTTASQTGRNMRSGRTVVGVILASLVAASCSLPDGTRVVENSEPPPTYVVQAGDSLSAIAVALCGDIGAADALFSRNEGRVQSDGRALTDRNVLHAGWELEIHCGSTELSSERDGGESSADTLAGSLVESDIATDSSTSVTDSPASGNELEDDGQIQDVLLPMSDSRTDDNWASSDLSELITPSRGGAGFDPTGDGCGSPTGPYLIGPLHPGLGTYVCPATDLADEDEGVNRASTGKLTAPDGSTRDFATEGPAMYVGLGSGAPIGDYSLLVEQDGRSWELPISVELASVPTVWPLPFESRTRWSAGSITGSSGDIYRFGFAGFPSSSLVPVHIHGSTTNTKGTNPNFEYLTTIDVRIDERGIAELRLSFAESSMRRDYCLAFDDEILKVVVPWTGEEPVPGSDYPQKFCELTLFSIVP